MTARVEGRIVGVDLARGLAVLGMFCAHVGPNPEEEGGLLGALMQLTYGRSSVLFAMLAGVSLALTTGRQAPNASWRHAARIVIRAVVLIVLGTYLTLMGTPIAVILAYYGVYFLLALPFLRLRATALFSVAVPVALAGPVFEVLARREWITWGDTLEERSGEGALQFLLTGYYPAVTWMAYVLVGMALGRLDLSAIRTRVTLAIIGPAMILLGYGGSSVALSLFGGPGKPMRTETDWLLVASPHSDTSFEIVGALGTAITVLVCALPIAEHFRRATRPVTAVGSMSLSVYTVHLLAIAGFELFEIDIQPVPKLLSFIAGSMVFSLLWMSFFRRGPLEYALYGITKMVPSNTPRQLTAT